MLDPRRRILATGLFLFVLVGCAPPRQLTRPECERVAWYFEDIAHGVPRDWRELVNEGMSDGLRRLASFARGAQQPDGSWLGPQPFVERAKRWPLLASALADGQVLIDEQGILHLSVGREDDVRKILTPVVAQENLDRFFGAQVLLRASGLRPDTLRASGLIALIQQAQLHHARAVGGKPWRETSTSNSASAATPSTSGREGSATPGR